MRLENVYDKVAQTYNQSLSGEVLTEAKYAAFDLVKRERNHLDSILALGMGDASDLLSYHSNYPQAELHGLDISSAMLERAQSLLECRTYHADIAQASSIIKKKNFDLITAYFVSAYVPLSTILQQSYKLLAKDGIISILTNTMESFPTGQQLMHDIFQAPKFLDRFWIPYIKKACANVHVPQDMNHLHSIMHANHFEVIQSKQIEISIHLNTRQEVFDFFINGGWFVSGLSHPIIPEAFLRKMSMKWIEDYVPLPCCDTLKIAVVLGKRIDK